MFTSSYTCAPMGTNPRATKCCPKKVWVVSCLSGAETEVKTAWSIWSALFLGWHIPNGTHPSVPCLTSPSLLAHRAATGGFPLPPCSLSRSCRQLEQHCQPWLYSLSCAQLWFSFPSLLSSTLTVLLQAFLVLLLGYTDCRKSSPMPQEGMCLACQ